MLNPLQFRIKGHHLFTPSTEQVFTTPGHIRFGKEKVLKFRNNPTAVQKEDGYWPRLTLNVSPAKATHGLALNLRVEFSAPKVLYGNNFDELVDIQFGDLVRSLCNKMQCMGVIVEPDDLGQSLLSSIHFSKNIILTDFTRCSMVLNELAKLNVWKRLDVNSKDYRNNGHVLKWHANSYEICVYDKVQDLQKARISPKRALEDDAGTQLGLFDDLQRQQAQVLRLEVRLNTRRKIKSVLKAIGEPEDTFFYTLFSKRIAAKILAYFWGELMQQHSMANILEIDLRHPEKFAEAIMAENPTMKPAKIASIIGTAQLLQQVGEKGLPVLFSRAHEKTVKRLIAECKTCQPTLTPRWTAIRQVKQQLEEFRPLRLKEWYNLTQGAIA